MITLLAGKLIVLSGPSGAGKTTLARRLLERHGGPNGTLARSVAVTTRTKREGEIDGKDYHFVTDARFTTLLEAGELLEHADIYGFYYGTPRSFVENSLEQGRDVLLVLDAHGRQQLASRFAGELVSVFLLPPSLDELEKRLRGRNEDDEETISRRLAAARAEIARSSEYDYVLHNLDLDVTLKSLERILRREGRQRQPQQPKPGLANRTLATSANTRKQRRAHCSLSE